MSRPRSDRQKRSLRPAVESMEGRELLSAAPLVPRLLAFTPAPPALTTPVQTTAGIHAMSSERLVGKTTPGLWRAANERVTVFAVEFQGSFSYANANAAWNWGVNRTKSQNISLVNKNSAGTVRTTGNIHYLIGWYNLDRKEGGWVAADYNGKRFWVAKSGPWWNPKYETKSAPTVKFFTNSNSKLQTGDSFSSVWRTRGYKVQLNINPQTNGDLVGNFLGSELT